MIKNIESMLCDIQINNFLNENGFNLTNPEKYHKLEEIINNPKSNNAIKWNDKIKNKLQLQILTILIEFR